jgi:hypothetical protein
MKRDQALSLLTKDKWALSEPMLKVLIECLETCQYEGIPFEAKNIMIASPPGYYDELTEILSEHSFSDIKNEICIRLLLNGYVEDQLFIPACSN